MLLQLSLLSLAATTAVSHQDPSSTSTTTTTHLTLSSCNDLPDQPSCFAATDDTTGDPCQWCVAGAIPSECMSADQAASLPEGVFECLSPNYQNSDSTRSSGAQQESLSSPPQQQSFEYEFDTLASRRQYRLKPSAAQPTKSDLCDDSSASLSGYMEVKGSDFDKEGENKHLFFWMFEKRGDVDENTPFVVWLTGGPGCSSTLALLTENGPCTVNADGASTTVHAESWTEAAHVLWLDQPAGVGFSYGAETDTNEAMIAEDAYYFFQAFIQSYPQYQSNPLYIVGESYGGHYAPAVAHRIWVGNQASRDGTVPLSLAGLAVGNGLTDPEHQYPAYVDMVSKNSHNITILDDATVDAMRSVVPKCTALIAQCNAGDGMIANFACQSAFLLCNAGLTGPYQTTGLNPYDIRKPCEVKPLCYDFGPVTDWLNSESTKQALAVDEGHSHVWNACNFGINGKFHTDWMKDFSGAVADLLNAEIPVLIYAGDVDFICNYLGNRAWTLALPWKGATAFAAAPEHGWKDAGLARTAEGLTFLQVYDAGHMVPADQPKVALDMIRNFVNGGDF